MGLRTSIIAAVVLLNFCAVPAEAQAPPAAGAATTSVGKEPPAIGKAAAAPAAANMRGDGGKLRQELDELEKSIKYAEEKLNLGHQASKAWSETSERVKTLLDDHGKQASACDIAKMDLKRREGEGTPEVYLRDAKKHVDKCDEARKRYRGMIATLETEVAKMLIDVNHITGNVEGLKMQQTEELRRKAVLQQLINSSAGAVKGKIDAFKNYQGF